VVDVPKVNLLKVDSEGDPNTSQQYADALEAQYSHLPTLLALNLQA
jgi:hypothetical protein